MDANITQSFIDMVEAYKAKPELESQIKQLRDDVEFFERNLRIEENITSNLKAEIERLNTSLSEVKKERDDAMFRSLELEDKFSGIEKLLGVAERLEQARQLEHQATVDAMTPKPLVEAAVVTEQGSTIVEPSYTGPIDPVVVEPQGQSDSRPTEVYSTEASLEPNGTTSKDGPETLTPSETSLDWDRNDSKQYLNKPYADKPWWVNDNEWYMAGGNMA